MMMMTMKTTHKPAATIHTMIDFEQSSTDKQPTTSELSRVAQLCHQLRELERQLDEYDQLRKRTQDKLNRIQFEELPSLLDEIGIQSLSLNDGTKITIKSFVQASLPTETAILRCKDPDKRAELQDKLRRGLQFLKKFGAGSLIKNQLKADFGQDSERIAKNALTALNRLGVKASLVKAVHPQTLVAWVKERLEAGKPVDMQVFSVFAGQKAILSAPKHIQTTTNSTDHSSSSNNNNDDDDDQAPF